MKKLNFAKIEISIVFILFSLGGLKTISAQTSDPLQFPEDNFTLETKLINTSTGEKEVTFRSYMHIPYVENPIDKDYQSLNVSVPIKINETEIDAKNAPILFNIKVGGYMSVRNAGANTDFRQRNNTESSGLSSREDLALAAGYVIVSPGCRGRDNQSANGTYYGKAPAAIVDLKAAVRYIRYNKGILPGNTEQIISVGCSAGGALSALLGASGNSGLYDSYLKEIGAADEKDNIFGTACYSPITDLEHADMAYEWMYGNTPTRSGLVDQELSEQLKALYDEYQSSLKLKGKNNFGIITSENYADYLLKFYLFPSLNDYLKKLPEKERNNYLERNTWISGNNSSAVFSFPDYVTHVGRMKGLPAFDDFESKQPEPILFGNETTNSRHFTDFSLQHSTGNQNEKISDELQQLVNLMNAMYFINHKNEDCAGNWWIRNGTSDNHTSQTVAVNLATGLENQNKNVNTWLFWDGGHCADDDPEGLIKWMGEISGYVQ